jgi:molybdopterin molybdotransferase
MTGYEEALQLLKVAATPLKAGETPLQASLGAVLAQDFHAVYDMPPFTRSPLDGFAFRAAGTAGAGEDNPACLQVVGRIPAGTTPAEAGLVRLLLPSEAVRIFTGAMLPPGADAVAAQEQVSWTGETLRVPRPYRPGENVVLAGEDVARGSLLLPAGCLLGPAELGLLAGQGEQTVSVYRRPRVVILTSGSELAEPGERLTPGRIYNSNRFLLEALVTRAGGEPVYAGRLPDDLAALAKAVANVTATADLVLTTGGVSVGDHDLIPAAVRLAGAEILFHRVAIRPGTPVLAARLGQALLLGLSGNPAACLVSFLQFALPALAWLRGLAGWRQQSVEARLAGGPVAGAGSQVRFLASRTLLDGDGLVTRPVVHQKPGVLSSFHGVNSLVVLPPGCGGLNDGSRVRVQVFPDIFSETPLF